MMPSAPVAASTCFASSGVSTSPLAITGIRTAAFTAAMVSYSARPAKAQARAVKEIERDPAPYVHYFIRETGGLLEPHEFQTWRLLHAPPQPYTRERFDDTYNWTVKWNMTVPGATYETVVDNRAWE